MNINEVKENAEKTGKVANFYLVWYHTESDAFIGDELLNVSEDMIREWFYLQPDDPQLDGLIVRASQRKQLQEHVKHQIDLNRFDYFIEYLYVFDNTM